MQKRDHGEEERYESQFFVTHDLKAKQVFQFVENLGIQRRHWLSLAKVSKKNDILAEK